MEALFLLIRYRYHLEYLLTPFFPYWVILDELGLKRNLINAILSNFNMVAAKRVMTSANYGKGWLTGLLIQLVKKLE